MDKAKIEELRDRLELNLCATLHEKLVRYDGAKKLLLETQSKLIEVGVWGISELPPQALRYLTELAWYLTHGETVEDSLEKLYGAEESV